jgi:hypothetical protein
MIFGCIQIPSVDGRTIVESCLLEDTGLPPITDTTTGIVFKNEFCALCNGVDRFQAWNTALVCADNVYDVIIDEGLSLRSILEEDLTVFSISCQPCSYELVPPARSCIPSIGHCLDKTTYEMLSGRIVFDDLYSQLVDSCNATPRDVVVDGMRVAYANSDCAFCNAVPMEDLQCFTLNRRLSPPVECVPGFRNEPIQPEPEPNFSKSQLETLLNESLSGGAFTVDPSYVVPFSFITTFLGGGEVVVRANGMSVVVPVPCPEGQVPVGVTCQATLCPEAYIEGGGRCSVIGLPTPTSVAPPQGNCSLVALGEQEFINLDSNRILFKGEEVMVLSRDELGMPVVCNTSSNSSTSGCRSNLLLLNSTVGDNGTVFYNGGVVEVLFYDSLGHPVICPDLTTLVEGNSTIITLPPGIAVLTYVGSSLSVFASVFVLVTVSLLKELRTTYGVLLANLSVAVLVTNLLFILGSPVIQYFPNVALCKSVAIGLHFCYLVQFALMSLLPFEAAREIYSTRKRAVLTVLSYMAFGWVLPFIIVSLTVGFSFISTDGDNLVQYGVTAEEQVGNCWINNLAAFLGAFFVPLALSVVVNLVVLAVIFVYLCLSSRTSGRSNTAGVTSDPSNTGTTRAHDCSNTDAARMRDCSKPNRFKVLYVCLSMLTTTSLTWGFGFLAITMETRWAWYPFVVFNTAQGVTIFGVFLFTWNVHQRYLQLITERRGSGNDGNSPARQERDIPPPVPERPDRTPPLLRRPPPRFVSYRRQQREAQGIESLPLRKMNPSQQGGSDQPPTHQPHQQRETNQSPAHQPHPQDQSPTRQAPSRHLCQQSQQVTVSHLQRSLSLPTQQRALIQLKAQHPTFLQQHVSPPPRASLEPGVEPLSDAVSPQRKAMSERAAQRRAMSLSYQRQNMSSIGSGRSRNFGAK